MLFGAVFDFFLTICHEIPKFDQMTFWGLALSASLMGDRMNVADYCEAFRLSQRDNITVVVCLVHVDPDDISTNKSTPFCL